MPNSSPKPAASPGPLGQLLKPGPASLARVRQRRRTGIEPAGDAERRPPVLKTVWAVVCPLQVDTFIAVGELALFVALADSWTVRSRGAVWTVTALGLAVSVSSNVGHVAAHDWTNAFGKSAAPDGDCSEYSGRKRPPMRGQETRFQSALPRLHICSSSVSHRQLMCFGAVACFSCVQADFVDLALADSPLSQTLVGSPALGDCPARRQLSARSWRSLRLKWLPGRAGRDGLRPLRVLPPDLR